MEDLRKWLLSVANTKIYHLQQFFTFIELPKSLTSTYIGLNPFKNMYTKFEISVYMMDSELQA